MRRPDIDGIRKTSAGIYLDEPQCHVHPLLDYIQELEAALREVAKDWREQATAEEHCQRSGGNPHGALAYRNCADDLYEVIAGAKSGDAELQRLRLVERVTIGLTSAEGRALAVAAIDAADGMRENQPPLVWGETKRRLLDAAASFEKSTRR